MSDDDLIRRGDVLRLMIGTADIQRGPSTDMQRMIRALPARGVGVKPWGWIGGNAACHHAHVNELADGLQSCTSCGAVRSAALAPTEPPEEIGILRARVEDQATEIARLTRIIQMQPPARTEAAQAREAAQADFVTLLTDAAAVAMKAREAALRQAADYIEHAPVGTRFQDRDAILAMISEART